MTGEATQYDDTPSPTITNRPTDEQLYAALAKQHATIEGLQKMVIALVRRSGFETPEGARVVRIASSEYEALGGKEWAVRQEQDPNTGAVTILVIGRKPAPPQQPAVDLLLR